MTPCEKLGYKVGDRFEALHTYAGSPIDVGDVIELSEDDESGCPWFNNITTGVKRLCYQIDWIKPLNPEWSGTALPPVGAKVNYRPLHFRPSKRIRPFMGHDATVRAVFKNGNGESMTTLEFTPCNIYVVPAECCKPIRTERDNAIDDLVDILDGKIGCTGTKAIAASIYDAGYRKQGDQ